ncbi:MAG: DUF2963 domain-containing protein [Lettuce witches'-broom phytoplasma]
MGTFEWKGRHWRIIPFIITTVTLLFFIVWIASVAYKYHLETEKRRELQKVDIAKKAKELNSALHEENANLKQENERLKSAPFEFIRNTGEKEYYNLFTHKLVKKIDLDGNIYEYDKNNGLLLLKKTDKDNNIYEYGSHGKLIKKTLSDGVWMEYNPVNEKLIKRQNIDGSIEEFDDNEEKFKETDKNGNIKYFKTQIYKTVADFKKLGATIKQLKNSGFTFTIQDLKAAGYTTKQLRDFGFTTKQLKNSGFTFTIQDLKAAGYTIHELEKIDYTLEDFIDAGFTDEEIRDGGYSFFKKLKQ